MEEPGPSASGGVVVVENGGFKWRIGVAGTHLGTQERSSMVIDFFESLPIVSKGCRKNKNCFTSYFEKRLPISG